MNTESIIEAHEPFASDEDRELYRQDVESGEASDPRNG